jgi:hypothetical protein
MRLIDADELKGKAFADPDDGEYFVYCQDIDEAPTVDAVPVVRCRYCASFEEIGTYPDNKGAPFGYCYHWPYEQGMSPNEVDGNDFCSHWERKVDENGRT